MVISQGNSAPISYDDLPPREHRKPPQYEREARNTPTPNTLPRSSHQIVHHIPMHVRKPEIPPRVPERQLRMVEAQ